MVGVLVAVAALLLGLMRRSEHDELVASYRIELVAILSREIEPVYTYIFVYMFVYAFTYIQATPTKMVEVIPAPSC
jgi:hypothetical protein